MEKRVQRSRSVVARQPIIADGRAITPLTSYTRSRDLASIGLLYTTNRERLAGGSGVAQKAESLWERERHREGPPGGPAAHRALWERERDRVST